VGGQAPPEIKVGGPRAMHPPVPPPMALIFNVVEASIMWVLWQI